MSDEQQKPPQFPRYQPPNPQGIPVADSKQTGILTKALKTLARTSKRLSRPGKGRSGHVRSSDIKIGHRKRTRFY